MKMKAMESINDLIEEAKLRTVWWALCIFSVTYFLSHTSSSMWINLPIAIMLVSALRILLNEVEFGWKSQRVVHRPSYLSHLAKKQLSLNDWRLSFALPPPKWKRKIDSPVVEAAATEFIDKIIKDFVVDLWYSAITPDKESPELMHAVIMDAIGEISGRVKEINLVDLLTRDVVDLIGDHLDLFRRNLASIGADVMATLSTEERDERLKHHLMDSKELHPALVSPESEYKVLQRLIGGVLALVLRPREAQSPLVRAIARELVTCLVMQPVMNLASPAYINQLIECILLAIGGDGPKDIDVDKSVGGMPNGDSIPGKDSSSNSSRTDNFDNLKDNQGTDMTLAKTNNHRDTAVSLHQQEPTQPHHADWARMLEAATQRRTEVLAPENLENMWTKGRNYKRKENRKAKPPVANSSSHTTTLGKEILPSSTGTSTVMGVTAMVQVVPQLSVGNLVSSENKNVVRFIQQEYGEALSSKGAYVGDELENRSNLTSNEIKGRLKRSNSTSALKFLTDRKMAFSGDDEGPIISEFYSPDFKRHSEYHVANKSSDLVLCKEGPFTPKLKCRVVGAYFEKIGSTSFAVYSIAVTDAENRTWFVKRRYRNFERLHRQLKEIPNYTLHLPPKRIFSSSTEDAFVHQRCIQLDKYLQDLLSIANVAEQHEVWDFLSVSSKNYSFGKSPSVMRTLAVNVDDAMDDIVRQFKGVSDGLMRKVVGSSSLDESSFSVYSGNLSWHVGDMDKSISRQDTLETLNSFSDNEENHNHEHHDQVEVSSAPASGSHSDNELNSKAVPPWDIKHNEESADRTLEKKHDLEGNSEQINQGSFAASKSTVAFNTLEDPYGMPPEWSPPNVSVPLLNLVDNVFQLKRRGWLRRQVFWISKQILQLIMEDAIDEWLLRQIYLLRREDTIAEGIRWLHNFLWPGGTFFTRVGVAQRQDDNTVLDLNRFQLGQFSGSNISKKGSFEEQLESTRRASDIKKMLFDGAPATLVSLIGSKQYKRCARDIFYFTQSTICMKQLAYGALELVLLSVFPELRELVVDLNEKMRVPPV